MTTHIAFLIYPNVTQLDFTGPAQVLSRIPDGEVHYVSKTLDPVSTDCGFHILPSAAFGALQQCDVLCVPGGFGLNEAIQDKDYLSETCRLAEMASYITSVCTGAFLLGAAGLLSGKRATTHWAFTGLLEKVGAHYEAARFVRDGHLITGGGVTAGIDFGLVMASELRDQATAQRIAAAIEYDPAPPFGPGSVAALPNHEQTDLISKYSRAVADLERLLAS